MSSLKSLFDTLRNAGLALLGLLAIMMRWLSGAGLPRILLLCIGLAVTGVMLPLGVTLFVLS